MPDLDRTVPGPRAGAHSDDAARTLEARIDVDFGRYDDARRGAAHLVRALDGGLADRQALATAGPAGAPRTDTPRYWLASAAAGLGAWVEGDYGLCRDAVRTAYSLAPTRTALMFALVLRRQDRLQSSVVWLRHYLLTVDPMALSREFATVLESVAHGAFGAAGRRTVRDAVDGWLRVLADDEEAQAAQTARWRTEIERHRPDGADAAFPLLRSHSSQWPALRDALRGAETNRPFFEHYDTLLSARYRTSEQTEDSLDDILDVLVAEYDAEEVPLRRELAFEQAVLDYGGDRARAREAADAESVALGDTLDYLTLQTSAALRPASIGVSPAAQQIALASCVEWAGQAHSAYCAHYRSRLPARVEIVLPEQRPIADLELVVPAWQGDLAATPMPALERSLTRHWETAVELAWAGHRRWAARRLARRHSEALGAARTAALARLRDAGHEYAAFLERFRAGDVQAERVRALIGSFGDVERDASRAMS